MKNGLITISVSLFTLTAAGIGTAFAATSAPYTVQSGDTLYKIATTDKIPFSTLEAANPQITNLFNIYPGEIINLPYTYFVEPGDTIYKIAVAQGVTVSALEAANPQITNYSNILTGQIIHIPNSATLAATSTTVSSGTAASASTTPAINTTQASSQTSSAIERQNIIRYAETFIGTPYAWGGETPSIGFDCSGFVEYVYLHFGITLPRESHDQATVGIPVSQANLQPGDLLFFHDTDSSASLYANHVTHVGIYIGNGSMIESSSSNNNEGVVIVNNVFSNPYYLAHYYGAQNVIDSLYVNE